MRTEPEQGEEVTSILHPAGDALHGSGQWTLGHLHLEINQSRLSYSRCHSSCCPWEPSLLKLNAKSMIWALNSQWSSKYVRSKGKKLTRGPGIPGSPLWPLDWVQVKITATAVSHIQFTKETTDLMIWRKC